ncbi:phage head spike fiber domain-containing protein [Spirosoma oryzicola]|uniref:phage head spike fiber domain-containing protein n=1 Tax=Spirosoma oryzicola TaxID=2898794 RepID=UPI001E3D3698|nr:hypothetical protein [Spirosoma oryzicola]UHG91775.1 hypothetical protein LQ777_02485 [Spirosoma oryzicola]
MLRTNNFRGGGIVPSLNLDFMQGVMHPALSYSRASAGTYFDSTGTLRTAAVNEPRFEYDPISGKLLGLLIEEQRTNMLLQSNSLNAFATNGNGIPAKTLNATTSPDATNNATLLSITTAGSDSGLRTTNAGMTPSTTYTLSVYAKANTGTILFMRNIATSTTGNDGAWFNLATGSVGVKQSNIASSSIVALAGGWYRCTITATTQATIGNNIVDVKITDADNGFGASAGKSIYVYGAQLEVGSFATSYIPTTTAAVTRSMDVCNINLGSWYNQSEGTLVMNALKAVPQGVVSRYYNFLPATGANPQWYLANDATLNRVTVTLADESGSTLFSGTSPNTLNTGSVMRTAAALRAGDCAFAVNGSVVGVGSPGSMPQFASLVLGNNSLNGARSLNGYLQRFTYYPRRLSNPLIQSLTQ